MVSEVGPSNSERWYHQSLLVSLQKNTSEQLKIGRNFFLGNLDGMYYIVNNQTFSVFDESNALLFQTNLEDSIENVYPLFDLKAAVIRCYGNKLKVFLPDVPELHDFPVTLEKVGDIRVRCWTNGTMDVVVFVADSERIILPGITPHSFRNAVINKELNFFTDNVDCAPLKEVGPPIALLCNTERPDVAVSISLRHRLKVTIFEDSLAHKCNDYDILCFTSTLESMSSFVKTEFVGSGYFVVLTQQRQLFLFNAIAGVYSGKLHDVSDVTDFAVSLRSQHKLSLSFDIYTLHQRMCGLVLEIRTYPARTLHLSVPLSGSSPLLFSRCELKSEPILVEQGEAALNVSTFLVTDLTDRLKLLIQEKKFAEARQFAVNFGLGTSLVSKMELLACLEMLAESAERFSSPTLGDQLNSLLSSCDSTCRKAVELLSEIEVLESPEVVLKLAIDAVIPRLEYQFKLLETITLKLPRDANKSREAVLDTLKRLEAFSQLHKYRKLSRTSWIKFTSARITSEFIECFSGWEEYSDGFKLWSMYRTNLMSEMNLSSVEAFLSLISLKPLTSSGDGGTSGSSLLEVESTLHAWLGAELVPSLLCSCPLALPLVAAWLVNRVKQLEKLVNDSVANCPFEWPGTAIAWVEGLLSNAKLTGSRSEITPQEEVNLLVSGLCSRSPEVDPFYPLRCLLFDLVTVKELLEKYNFRLSLEDCGNLDAKSIAIKLVDVAVTSRGESDDCAPVVPRVANFIKERGLNSDIVYCDYCYSILAVEPTTLLHLPSPSKNETKQLPMPDSTITAELIQRACLAASWITSLGCRYKAAQFLVKVAPLPWPLQLHSVVDSVLADHSLARRGRENSAFRILSRQSNRAKAAAILSEYEIDFDDRHPSGLTRTLSALLLHAPPPWLKAPQLASSFHSCRSRQEVHADALRVARLLSPASATYTFAVAHLQLAIGQALHVSGACPVNNRERVDYVVLTVFKELLSLEMAGCQNFVEKLFATALRDLASSWATNCCGTECSSIYLDLFACISLEAVRTCGLHSNVVKEARQCLRYIQLSQKILQHHLTPGFAIFSQLQPPLKISAASIKSLFEQCGATDPFEPRVVSLFNLLLRWTKTCNETTDVDILLVEAWLSDQRSLRAVVMATKQLLERLMMRRSGLAISQNALQQLVTDALLPFVIKMKDDLEFDQVASLLECIRALLESTLSEDIFSRKQRCIINLLTCITVVFSKLSQKFCPSQEFCGLSGLLLEWKFSLLFDEKIPENVDQEMVQSLSLASLQWLLRLMQSLRNKDLESGVALLSEGLHLAAEYASKLGLEISVSIPMVGSLTSLFSEDLYDGSQQFSQKSDQDSHMDQLNSNLRGDLVELMSRVLCEYVSQWMSFSLARLFSATRLDLPLAFGLAVCLPLTTSSSQLRQIVAANPRAANKTQVVASMIFKAANLLPSDGSPQLIEMARGLSVNAKWDAALRVYGLRLSRRDPRPDVVLGHLLEIVPLSCSLTATQQPPLCSTFSTPKPVPPVIEIVEFCRDFNLDPRQSLLQHLKILLESPFPDKLSVCGDGLKCFREYSLAKLSRAAEIHKALLNFASLDRAFEEEVLVVLLKLLFAKTSPYDYEQLRFLLNAISCSEDMDQAPKMYSLLTFLRRYKLQHDPSGYSHEKSPGSASIEDLSDTSGYILQKYRLPFHPLCSSSGFPYISNEINRANMYKWLKLDGIMKWGLSDSIRIAVVSNGFRSLQKLGVLRLMPQKITPAAAPGLGRFFSYTVPASSAPPESWKEALACRSVIRSFLTSAYHTLLPVANRMSVLGFLGVTRGRE
uniref:Fanconi anemia group I protein n=1 Tax=Mesocestoides corti TaxID=53468 RepID=A0A5K3F2G7_MESCO